MGGQCSSEALGRRASNEEEEDFGLDVDKLLKQREAGSCSGWGRSNSADHAQAIDCSSCPTPTRAGAEKSMGKSELINPALDETATTVEPGSTFEEFGFQEAEDEMRMPPACPEAEDNVSAVQWEAMLSCVDRFVTPLETDYDEGGSASASSRSPRSGADHAHRRPIGEEMQREAAFASINEGRPLYTVPERFRADKEVVLAAIGMERQYCYDFIAPELRQHDRDVVFALIEADGSLLEWCSEELRADRQLVRLALRSSSEALTWAPKSMQQDKELKAIAAARLKEEQSLLKRFEAKICAPAPRSFWPGRAGGD